ncbi:MAG: hypothetical protein KF868_00155 [Acidobacteria bacterium]|nr:hypothetical protein [Acidobacteriota bacterium]MCW5969475.1 hypothetical protein [Blastocatellales bacterium]
MVYIIDAADRVIHLDEDWVKCAGEMGREDLAPGRILGRTIWSFLHGIETVHLYRLLVRRARRGAQIEFRLVVKAGGEAQLRRMKIQAIAGGESVVFESSPIEAAEPDSTPLLSSGEGEAQESLLIVCSWCDRVKLPDETWVEVEQAVSRLGLFERETPPKLTHGVCEDCFKSLGGGDDRRDDRTTYLYVDAAGQSS